MYNVVEIQHGNAVVATYPITWKAHTNDGQVHPVFQASLDGIAAEWKIGIKEGDFNKVLAEKHRQKEEVQLALVDAETVPAITDEAAPSLSGSLRARPSSRALALQKYTLLHFLYQNNERVTKSVFLYR